jgi:hypothetical protein
VGFVLHFIYIIDQLVPYNSLCVVPMCMITVYVNLCILLCTAETDGESREAYVHKLCVKGGNTEKLLILL